VIALRRITDLRLTASRPRVHSRGMSLSPGTLRSNRVLCRGLGVLPTNVVDEDRHRGQAVERGVWSPVIVEPQPTSEGATALGVGAIQPPIGPLIQQGLVEPLDLAIGLGGRYGRVRLSRIPSPAAVSVKTTDSAYALALSVNTRWMTTPCSAKKAAASTRNRAEVAPVSSARSWLKATRERSSTAEWR
jgi:hypothetical protein